MKMIKNFTPANNALSFAIKVLLDQICFINNYLSLSF